MKQFLSGAMIADNLTYWTRWAAKRTLGSKLNRTNYRGRTVSLSGGIGLAAGIGTTYLLSRKTLGTSLAIGGAIAVTGAAVAGANDDFLETDPGTKGLRGHLEALREGRVTTGAIKLAALVATGLTAAAVQNGGKKPAQIVCKGALVASWANLFNLLDLRPGRALKAGLLVSALQTLPPPTRAMSGITSGAALEALAPDLFEESMLGDTGANALGAAIGYAFANCPVGAVRFAALTIAVAGNLASEKISFSEVIANQPQLRALDAWGRSEGT